MGYNPSESSLIGAADQSLLPGQTYASYSRLLLTSFLILFCYISSGCAVNTQPVPESTTQKYWPAPPVKPRYVHEATLRYIQDIAKPTDAQRMRAQILGPAPKQPAFIRPYDIAANYGRIYISDSDAGAVSVFDVPRRHFYQLGIRLKGKLIRPMGLALDNRSNVFIADIGSKKIQVFDFLGMHLNTFGGQQNLQQPISIAIDPVNELAYVIDNGGIDSTLHRVLVYNLNGKFLRSIGKRGHGEGEFNLPTDAVVGSDGTLYVLDAGNFRVQAFDTDGNLTRIWGTAGSGFGQLARPRSIAIDRENRLYITDMFFGNFQVFNTRGELLLPVGKLDADDLPGHYRLISGINVDETQRVYVVDQFFKKVEVFRFLDDRESEKIVQSRK